MQISDFVTVSDTPKHRSESQKGQNIAFFALPDLLSCFVNYKNISVSVRNGRPSTCPRCITFHGDGLNSKVTCPPDGQIFQSFIKTPAFIYVLLVLFYWSKRQQRFCVLVPSTKLWYTNIREWCEWWDGDNMNDMLDNFFWHGIWLTLIENAVKWCALILKIRTKLCWIFSTNKWGIKLC